MAVIKLLGTLKKRWFCLLRLGLIISMIVPAVYPLEVYQRYQLESGTLDKRVGNLGGPLMPQ